MDREKIDYKIVLLGSSDAGKTSLYKKLTSGSFKEYNISTIGIDRKTIQVEIEINENNTKINKKIDVNLIDTAGQERFRAITNSYMKGSDGFLLLYNVTNRESFTNLDSWIKGIHESLGNHQNSKYTIIIIGTQIELIGIDGMEREVTEEEGEYFCKEKDLIWGGEISIKNIGYEELLQKFKNYVKLIYDKAGEKKRIKKTYLFQKLNKFFSY